MLTVGKAAKRFHLSRTTLLYYDQIGLLCPAQRLENGYRLYSESDIDRLEQIAALRAAGIPLAEIAKYLETDEFDAYSILLRRLGELNREIDDVKRQQEVIVKLLKSNDLRELRKAITPHRWSQILEGAGIRPDTATQWHQIFEKNAPQQHRLFLQALCFSQSEIEAITGKAERNL